MGKVTFAPSQWKRSHYLDRLASYIHIILLAFN